VSRALCQPSGSSESRREITHRQYQPDRTGDHGRALSRGCLPRKEEAICFVVVVEKKQQRTLNIRLGRVAGRDG